MKALRGLADLWRRSPAVRAIARAAASGAAGYVADSFRTGHVFSLTALGVAAGTAAGYAVLGILTPLEPYVGPAAAKARVEVPVPPADPEPARNRRSR